MDLLGTTVIGGTLTSVDPTYSPSAGIFRNSQPATLQNVTLTAGSYFYVYTLKIAGTLTNDGTFLVVGSLNLPADVTLAGTGTVRLAGGSGSGTLDATNNATLTVAAGVFLEGGSGTINASVVNNGTVSSVYQGTTINSPTFTNNGVLAVTDSSGNNSNTVLAVSDVANLTNFNAGSGTLTGGSYTVTDVGDGTYLEFGSRNVQINAATIILSGAGAVFNGLSSLATNAGTLTLLNLNQLTTSATLTNNGTLNLDAGTTLHVGGGFSGDSGSTLAITLGGTQSSGAQSPGVLQVGGAATAGGTLTLTFAAGATLPGNGDMLTILSAGSPVQGSFGNAANGARLATTDGKGSFRVSYGGSTDTVTLSDFLLPGQADLTPTATLTAVVPSVSVGRGQEAEFQLSLSSPPSSDVVVNFSIKGSAVNGTDYLLLKDTKKIKAGHTSKPIKIQPLGNLGGASKKTVVLTLLPGDGYQVGTTGKVKVKLTD